MTDKRKEAIAPPEPSSYYSGYSVLEFIRKFKLNFARGSIIKYVARAGNKDNELLDLLKARDYLNSEIALLTEKEE